VALVVKRTSYPPMPTKLNQKRALFVLGKIDEILAWVSRKESEKDTRFVEFGRYLCEVRAGQYWRRKDLKSFDDFLERRFLRLPYTLLRMSKECALGSPAYQQ